MTEEQIAALKAAIASDQPEALGDGHILAALIAFMESSTGQALLKILISLLPASPA